MLVMTACQSGGKTSGGFEVPDSIYQQEEAPVEISEEAMESIVQNIASPIEMAALIKTMDVPYSRNYLAPTNEVNEYASPHAKAFNLGVYGADLGYINMYSRQTHVIEYITAIRQLADDLNVGQFFDFSTLRRLASSSQDIDSMMYISVNSFNRIDRYLRENKRGNLSALMVSGVWVEGLYLGTQVVKDHPQDKLIQAVGEQKTVLNQLMLLLELYKRDQFVVDLIKELSVLKEIFDDIKITIEVGEPESVIKDGRLTIIQHEKSVVHITDEQLDDLIEKARICRENLISVR
jgi:hypothetical protein